MLYRFFRRTTKILAILGLAIFLLGWIVQWTLLHKTKEIISDQLEKQTKGKFKIQIGSVSVNYLDLQLQLHQSTVEIMDPAVSQETVRISTPFLSLQLGNLKGLLFSKDLKIDSIVCHMPNIMLNPVKKHDQKQHNISYEMGQILSAIKKTLHSLQVQHLSIIGGQITYYKNGKEHTPVVLSSLNLGVNHFRVDHRTSSDSATLFHSNIHFNAGKQTIKGISDNTIISFKQIDIATGGGDFVIDSLMIIGSKRSANFNLFFEKLYCKAVDYEKLASENIFAADSIVCKGSRVSLNFLAQGKAKNKHHTTEAVTQEAMTSLLSNVRVRYLNLGGSFIDITIVHDEKEQRFKSQGHSIELIEVGMGEGLKYPLQIGEINIQIKNHSGVTSDSTLKYSFDRVSISRREISLQNFKLVPSETYKGRVHNDIQIPEVKIGNFSFASLLFERKIKADYLVINRPKVEVFVEQDPNKHEHRPVLELLARAQERIGFKHLQITNGTLHTYNLTNGREIRASGIQFDFSPEQLLSATNMQQAMTSISSLEVQHFTFTYLGHNLKGDQLRITDQGSRVAINRISWRNKENELIARDFAVKGLKLKDAQNILIDSLTYASLTVNATVPQRHQQQTKQKSPPGILIKHLELRHTELTRLSLGDVSLQGQVPLLMLQNLSSGNSSALDFDQLTLLATDLIVRKGGLVATVRRIDGDTRSDLRFTDIRVSDLKEKESAVLQVRQISILPDWEKLVAQRRLEIRKIRIDAPRLTGYRTSAPTAGGSSKLNLPEIKIDEFSINDLSLNYRNQTDSATTELHTRDGSITLSNISCKGSEISFSQGQLLLDSVFVRQPNLYINSGSNPVRLKAENFQYSDGSLAALLTKVSAGFDTLSIRKVTPVGTKTTALTNVEAELEYLRINTKENLLPYMLSGERLQVDNISFDMKTSTHDLRLTKFSYSAPKEKAGLAAIDYTPHISRELFFKIKGVQTEYMQLSANDLVVDELDLADLLTGNRVVIGDLTIGNLQCQMARDKNYPEPEYKVKLLPTGLLEQLPFSLTMRKFQLLNGKVQYNEISSKTDKEGAVSLTRIKATATNIVSRPDANADSLRLHLDAYLLDTARMEVRFAESYQDTLHGFHILIKVQPFDMTILNVLTVPLASIQIRSGKLNKLHMAAVGREYISLGEMTFHYENLKVDILGNNAEVEKNIVSGFTNLVANDVVLRTNNDHRKGIVYFERLRNKSVVNYWVKMTLSGIMTTVGVKKSVLMKRRYRRYVKKNQLPEIE